MGLDVALEDESGNQIEYVGDPKCLINSLLPAEDDSEYPLLGSIDFYADTIFNTTQMSRFLAEWHYVASQATTEEEKQIVAEIERMARRCATETHSYLKFLGD